MIDAYFKGKSLIIDLSNIGEKYYGKDIKFKLMYGMELTNGENETYSEEGSISILFNGQKTISIKVNNIKPGYRGEMIWIGYYIEADFGSKLLIFRDTKDINISGREESVFKSSDLKTVKSGEYIGYTDKINKKIILNEIFKNFIKDLLLFIPNLIKYLFSSVISFIFGGFLISLIGSVLLLIIIFLLEINVYLGYSSAFIIYLLLVFIKSYFKYSKIGIDIKFNDKFSENINLNKLLSGKAKKEINDIDVKVFGINQERGWYEYDCGSSTCTAYINHTVGNILLFSKKIEKINIGEDISKYLDYKINIEKIYQNLFYAQKFSSNMGLFVGIEIRIISKKYKDINHIFYIDLDKNKFKKQINLNKKNNLENNDSKEEEFNTDFFN